MPSSKTTPEAEVDTPSAELDPGPSPVTLEPTAKRTAVVLVAGNTLPAADIRIVVEGRKYATDADGRVTGVDLKKSNYPTGADFYLRYDPEVQFPKDANVLTMGVDVQQFNFSGFTRQRGLLNVGPAHPAYAAANLAYQEGATHIEIVGLTDAEKEKLQPYFDALGGEIQDPAPTVSVTLT